MKKLLITLTLLSCRQPSDYRAAEKSAHEFIQHIDNAKDVSCTQVDTDNDGYCTCTVFRKDGLEPMSIQCGCAPEPQGCWSSPPARGCKITQPKMNVNVQAQ